MKQKIFLLSLLVLLIPAVTFAIPFKNIGSRASALGGAYVTLAEDALGMYYNPAGLSGQKGFDFNIFFGIGGDNYINQDDIDKFDDLADYLDKDDYDNANKTFDQIKERINNSKTLVSFEPDLGFGFRVKNFGIFLATANVVSLSAYLDKIDTTGADVSAGNSTITGEAAITAELGLSYGRQMFYDGLDLGLTLKLVGGVGKNVTKKLDDIDDAQGFAEDDLGMKDIKIENPKFSLDLGAKYTIYENKLMVGMVIKNITSPKIKKDTNDTTSMEIKFNPMVRIGARWKPKNWCSLVADLDVTKNKIFAGVDSQKLGLGFEMNLINRRHFNIPLRLGYSTDIAADDPSDILSVGAGLHFLFAKIDFSGGLDKGMDPKERAKFANINVSIFW